MFFRESDIREYGARQNRAYSIFIFFLCAHRHKRAVRGEVSKYGNCTHVHVNCTDIVLPSTPTVESLRPGCKSNDNHNSSYLGLNTLAWPSLAGP